MLKNGEICVMRRKNRSWSYLGEIEKDGRRTKLLRRNQETPIDLDEPNACPPTKLLTPSELGTVPAYCCWNCCCMWARCCIWNWVGCIWKLKSLLEDSMLWKIFRLVTSNLLATFDIFFFYMKSCKLKKFIRKTWITWW